MDYLLIILYLFYVIIIGIVIVILYLFYVIVVIIDDVVVPMLLDVAQVSERWSICFIIYMFMCCVYPILYPI